MSMSEERHSGDLLESRASSTKVALGVAGVVLGLGVLVCGGVAGYVALTATFPPEVAPPAQPVDEARDVAQLLPTIMKIDIPADFEPVSSEFNPMMKNVAYRRKGVDGAILMLARADLSQIPENTDFGEAQTRLLSILEMQDRRRLTAIKVSDDSQRSTREFFVLDRPTTFLFVDGRTPDKGTAVTKVSSVFRSRKAYLGFIYLTPTADYDEHVLRTMIDSIRPAMDDSLSGEGDAAKSAESGLGGSRAGEPKDELADPEKPESVESPDGN